MRQQPISVATRNPTAFWVEWAEQIRMRIGLAALCAAQFAMLMLALYTARAMVKWWDRIGSPMFGITGHVLWLADHWWLAAIAWYLGFRVLDRVGRVTRPEAAFATALVIHLAVMLYVLLGIVLQTASPSPCVGR